MTRAEHEAVCKPLRERLFDSEQKRIHWQGEANALRPDAEAMRKKRAADRKRMAGKSNG